MKTTPSIGRIATLSLIALVGAAAPAPRVASVAATPVTGDYVEARTASVFAGACHYNGERVTDGRSAVMAWHITGGSFNGADLAGVKVMAAIVCDENLAELTAARKTEIAIDATTDVEAAAAVAWVTSRCGDQLGVITRVAREPITFRHDTSDFAVSAKGFAAISVQPMPNHECCQQPNLVWYAPLMPIESRRVGYTRAAEYDAAHVGDTWSRTDENSAFYGKF